jgi:hypothetical protein
MNAKLFCRSANKGCDLGDILEYHEGDWNYKRALVRVTDWDTLVIVAKKTSHPEQMIEYYSAGGIRMVVETVGDGQFKNCGIEKGR